MELQCPYCHARVELGSGSPWTDIECASCGRRFSLVSDDTMAARREHRGDDGTPIVGCRWLGHFELHRQLGMGKFGRVWLAHDRRLHRQVAVKIPRQSQLDPEETEFFLREARAAAQLKHPGIVSVHEVGREDGTVYIVSDYIEGESLKEWLAGHRLTLREAAELVVQIAVALDHAHAAGVVHRDLKPGNILMDLDGCPHIADFGLAKRDSGEVTMTLDGNILGTPAYMPPEQARGAGHAADRRSDVYSLGVILFELLTGELPFRGDQQTLLAQIVGDEPPSPRKFNARIPRDLETIALKCLQKEPDRRYATAAALADDLGRHLRGEAIRARPIGRAEHAWRWVKRNPLVALLSGVAALLLVVVTIVSTLAAWRIGEAQLETQHSLDQTRATIDELFTSVSEEMLLNEPGMQELQRKLLEKARQHYERLAARRLETRDQAELARAQFRLGELERLLGHPRQAEAAFRQALAIHDALGTAQGGDLALRSALADTQNALAATLQSAGHRAEAQRLFEQALGLREELAAGDDAELDRKVASVLMNLAFVHHEQGQSAAAIGFLDRAQAIRQQLLGSADATVRDKVLRDLAVGHYNRAHLQAQMAERLRHEGQLQAARAARADVVRHCDQAIEQFGAYLEHHSRELDNRFRQAVCYRLKADASDDLDAALAAYAAGEAMFTPLVEGNPSVPEYRFESARLHMHRGRQLGRAASATGKAPPSPSALLAEAAATLAQSNSALHKLVDESPERVAFQLALVESLSLSEIIARAQGDEAESRRFLAQLRDRLAALVALTGDDVHRQRLNAVEARLAGA